MVITIESPLHLRKRISILRSSPKDKLEKLVPELKELSNELQRLQRASESDPLYAIVPFFDQVSRWHDRSGEILELIKDFKSVNWGQYTPLIEELDVLQIRFVNAGRDRYGWNRTYPGERVTEDRVFLGDIYGLFTHPVSYWKQKRDKKKGGWGFSGMEHLNAYDVVSQQASCFLLSHTGPMLRIIQILIDY
jgi:hypothetical protein